MADVYEGVDTRLGRVVAIKLLKADLASDPSFESRFRQEAQSSARMAHPTIVRVYDTGEDQSSDQYGNQVRRPYIVMEFVKGTVLRDLMHSRHLTIAESIDYAEGVLTALEISHNSGIVHRDIKSANIMISESGQVKVMDFGIARVVSSNTSTQAHTSGIVGTAQYFSPEQARGEVVDFRSDLYSTGVLLYEMLAGRPPFRGETAVSVAYQHVSEAVVAPSVHNPLIPAELDEVIFRALAKNKDDRFQSAAEFREHLLAATGVSFEAQTTSVVPLRAIEEDDPLAEFDALLNGGFSPSPLSVETVVSTQAIVEPVQEFKPAEQVRVAAAFEPSASDNPFAELGVELQATDREATITKNGREKSSEALSARTLWTVGTALVVILIGISSWLVTGGKFNFSINPTAFGTAVTDVTGKTFDEGKAALEAQGLAVLKKYQFDDEVPADTIISSDPQSGSVVSEKTVITVYVSQGKAMVAVPSLSGMTEADASAAITAAGLQLGTITVSTSATVKSGRVISVTPAAGTSVASGTIINFTVSNGKINVPDVVGLTVDSAKSRVAQPEFGMSATVDTGGCTGTVGDTVINQSPKPGLVKQGTDIVLFVGCTN
jgi:serine/threonine-protein kinase